VAGRTSSPQANRWKREFGEHVRTVRLSRGMSQEQLADAADVHRTYVGAIERGEQNVSLVLIHMIAEALEVAPASLIGTTVAGDR
jgi:transcriptional regulator with XRE-family HTH domain